MKILLQALTLINFKGIRERRIEFGDVTDILGHNGTGKTTLLDAFLWCLFGKDSSGRSDFEIKTVDQNNKPYHKLEHSVAMNLMVDGSEISLRREYKEKWVTERGQREEKMNGHTTSFFWNDVPMKESEYQAKVRGLIEEGLFRLLTNVNHFNSLKWQDRRAVLIPLAGNITDDDVAAGRDDFKALMDLINGKKSLEEYKKEVGAAKKKIKDELDLLPSKIQEAQRAVPDPVNYTAVQSGIDEATEALTHVESLLSSKSAAQREHEEKVMAMMQERSNLSQKAFEIESRLKREVSDKKVERENKIYDLQREIRTREEDRQRANNEYSSLMTRKTGLVEEQVVLRAKWDSINQETPKFDPSKFCCPTCNREYEAVDIEAKKAEMTRNFNEDKSKRTAIVSERGKTIGQEIADLDVRIANLQARNEELKAEVQTIVSRKDELTIEHNRLCNDEVGELQKALAANTELSSIVAQVNSLSEQISAPFTVDNSDLLTRKRDLQQQIDSLKSQLATKGIREKQEARVQELIGQESTLAQKLSDLESTEYTILQFEKEKMDLVEERINGKFQIAKFKMFEEQINGGQVPACTTLIGGVPYADANNAARIQAGLDIINVLSDHYGVQAPVWIDNRESVINLPATHCQIINLKVSENHSQLTLSRSRAPEEAVA
jgi:exonuclease SbcC